MKHTSQKIVTKTLIALAMFACIGGANAYEFSITNSTESKITAVQASEDGKTWGAFDMGAGLPAGENTTITWDSSTDSSGCDWLVKASYADGSESLPAKFDFCEDNIELEFTE